jgi:hypothetical protein
MHRRLDWIGLDDHISRFTKSILYSRDDEEDELISFSEFDSLLIFIRIDDSFDLMIHYSRIYIKLLIIFEFTKLSV